MKILLTIIFLLVLSITCTNIKHIEIPTIKISTTTPPYKQATIPATIPAPTPTMPLAPTSPPPTKRVTKYIQVPPTPSPTSIPKRHTPVTTIYRQITQQPPPPTVEPPNEYIRTPTNLFANAFVQPTNTPRPTRQPTPEPTLAYNIDAITKYYSAPSFNVHDIQVQFITHILHSNKVTYPQDTCYRVKYINRQGKSKSIKLKFSLFNYNQQDEYIQLYEISSPGAFDDANTQDIQQALKNLKNNKETHKYSCN